MKRMLIVALFVLAVAGFVMAQNPTYSQGTGITGIDKLGAHQNGGRGCVGCHAPHSGARGNGGNGVKDANGNFIGGAVTDPDTGNYALWGQDLSPLYGQTLNFGDADENGVGSFDITFGSNFAGTEEQVVTGVMMCLSCHDGNVAAGAMMANQSYEQSAGLLPTTYGPQPIPTLLGNDGTARGNYKNDHPIGEKATLGAVGVANATTPSKGRVLYTVGGCTDPHDANKTMDCILPNTSNTQYVAFINHYGSFNVTMKKSDKDANGNLIQPLYAAGGRVNPVVLNTTTKNAADAYLVCTTCHTPHSMYVFSGNAGRGATLDVNSQVLPTYFFIAAPYNPGAPVPDGTKASSATQFCRQCHFTGAGGSNEGSNILNVTTQY